MVPNTGEWEARDAEPDIVRIIEEARLHRGISVAELARRIGVDRKRLWYVLNNQRAMRVDEFLRLCAFFDMGLGRFVARERLSRLRKRPSPRR